MAVIGAFLIWFSIPPVCPFNVPCVIDPLRNMRPIIEVSGLVLVAVGVVVVVVGMMKLPRRLPK